jgi:hypothetical protein
MATRPIMLGSAANAGAAEQPHACGARHVSLATPVRRASVQPLNPYEASGLSRFEPSEFCGPSNESPPLIGSA